MASMYLGMQVILLVVSGLFLMVRGSIGLTATYESKVGFRSYCSACSAYRDVCDYHNNRQCLLQGALRAAWLCFQD